MNRAVSDFIDLVVDHPRAAPRWWKKMLAEWVAEILRRRALIDAAEPYTEIQRIRRAA